MESNLKNKIQESVRAAMRARDRSRLATLRLISAELKQVEIDERQTLNDADVVSILSRMIKQRRSSIEEYVRGSRQDLADQEKSEIEIIEEFMPQQLSKQEILTAIDDICAELGASTMQDMGKVMGRLSKELAGRADMSAVSSTVRSKLSAPN